VPERPQHAAVFCVHEKTAIQALDQLEPVLPLSPGRAERHRFEYYRHGTLSLYAALDTKWGKVLGKTAASHTSQEFVEFLTEVVERAPAREVHINLDNLSAHKSQVVRDFLTTHPNVHFHFTPTYSSWLNQVEIWFSKVERDVIARGNFYQREGSGPQASPAVLLRDATPSVLHQRHIGRVLRSSCNFRGRRFAS
jgi:transposase